MIRFVSSIIAVFFLALLIWFSVSNTQSATLRLAILSPEGLRLPMAIWIGLTTVVGFLLGALLVWIQAGSRRSALRKTNRKLVRAEDEVERLQAELNDREADVARLETEIAELKTIDQPTEQAPQQPLPAI